MIHVEPSCHLPTFGFYVRAAGRLSDQQLFERLGYPANADLVAGAPSSAGLWVAAFGDWRHVRDSGRVGSYGQPSGCPRPIDRSPSVTPRRRAPLLQRVAVHIDNARELVSPTMVFAMASDGNHARVRTTGGGSIELVRESGEWRVVDVFGR